MATDLIFTLDLDTKTFIRKTLEEIQNYINRVCPQYVPRIRRIVGDLIVEKIQNSPEYNELVGGALYGKVGVTEIYTVVIGIIRAIRSGMDVQFIPAKIVGNVVQASFTVGFLKDDFSEALSVQGTSFISDNGQNVPWLQWLLFEGPGIILADYTYVFNPYVQDYSKTGEGIMVPSDKGFGFGQYGGVQNDNWLTRAFKDVEQQVIDEIQVALTI